MPAALETVPAVDLSPAASAAGDYAAHLSRLAGATTDALSAWQSLPAALRTAGTGSAESAWVRPAAERASGLSTAAGSLSASVAAAASGIAGLRWQASLVDDASSFAPRITDAVMQLSRTVAAIAGGESTGRGLPSIQVDASFGARSLPGVGSLSGVGAALGRGLASGLVDLGTLGALGADLALVLGLGGSTDVSDNGVMLRGGRGKRGKGGGAGTGAQSATKGAKRKASTSYLPIAPNPYLPCDPIENVGCDPEETTNSRPGERPFTGSQMTSDEDPGVMRGTEKWWNKWRADNGNGHVYSPSLPKDENGSVRVTDPGKDPRYPNGYVRFLKRDPETGTNRPLKMDGTFGPNKSAETHFPRYSHGDFPTPKGWNIK